MKHVLLIGGISSSAANAEVAKKFLADFRTIMKQQHEAVAVRYCFYDEISILLGSKDFIVKDLRNKRDLKRYDLVIFKGAILRSYVPYTITAYLQEHDVAFINNYGSYRQLNKLPQLLEMYRLGLPFPKTLYLENRTLLAAAVIDKWKFPVVVKAVNGSRGRYNYLARNRLQLQKILAKHKLKHYLVQEYVPAASDYRVLVIGKDSQVYRRSSRSGDFIHNTSRGGAIEALSPTHLPETVLKQARQLAKAFQADIAGVDVLYDSKTETTRFLEINTQPAIGQSDSRATLENLIQQKL